MGSEPNVNSMVPRDAIEHLAFSINSMIGVLKANGLTEGAGFDYEQACIESIRAALRSDSPVRGRDEREHRDRNRSALLTILTAAVKEGRRRSEPDDVRVAEIVMEDWPHTTEGFVSRPRPASTGGERDELSPEQVTEAQDMADEVVNAVIREWREMKRQVEGAVPLTLEGRGYGPNWKIVVRYSNALRELLRGPGEENEYHGVLLPRPQVGDQNDE